VDGDGRLRGGGGLYRNMKTDEYHLTFSGVFGVTDHESGLILSNFLPLTPSKVGIGVARKLTFP